MPFEQSLSLRHGKGFSRSNVSRFRQFYLLYPICATVPHKLSWTLVVELLKKTLSTPRKRPAPSQREPAPDLAFERIAELATSLRVLQQQAAAAFTPVVHDLIERRCRDEKEIEHTLDHLLDCACIPEGLTLFKSLCRHYYGIDPAATADYVYAYRDMWDSEVKLKGPGYGG